MQSTDIETVYCNCILELFIRTVGPAVCMQTTDIGTVFRNCILQLSIGTVGPAVCMQVTDIGTVFRNCILQLLTLLCACRARILGLRPALLATATGCL